MTKYFTSYVATLLTNTQVGQRKGYGHAHVGVTINRTKLLGEKRMNNPYKDLILYACDKAVTECISGHMSFDEAIDYANNLCNQLADTDEFKKISEDFFDNFIDVKNIGDINNETN